MKLSLLLLLVILISPIYLLCQDKDIVVINENNRYKIYNIINENFMEYFNLYKKYDSELKRKVFFETEECQRLKDSILTLKYLLFSKRFQITYNVNLEYYDLKKKAFLASLFHDCYLYDSQNDFKIKKNNLQDASNELYGFWFSALNFEIGTAWFQNLYQYLVIPCDESTALELERKYVDILIKFDISEKQTVIAYSSDRKQEKLYNAINVNVSVFKSKKNILSIDF